MRNNEHRSWKRFAACLMALSLLLLLPVFGQAEISTTRMMDEMLRETERLQQMLIASFNLRTPDSAAERWPVCCEPDAPRARWVRVSHGAVGGGYCSAITVDKTACYRCGYVYSEARTYVSPHPQGWGDCPL